MTGLSRKIVCQAQPKISIITPSYNQGKYLEKTIESVVNQNYPNIEYIVIDGGSEDESIEIIKKNSANLAYWVSEKDRGQSHAINKGFLKGTGDIYSWLNSDDIYYSSDVLSRIVDWFKLHPECNVCYGHNIYINEEDELLFCRGELPFFSQKLLEYWNFIHQPTVFLRSTILDGYKLDESLHYCMDYEFWLRISEQHKFCPSHIIVSASRWHSDSKTVREKNNSFKELESLRLRKGLSLGIFPMIVRKVGYIFLRLVGAFLPDQQTRLR